MLASQLSVTERPEYPTLPLPAGVSENYVDCTGSNGLVFHCLEAGYDPEETKPLLLLVHGYPELAFSWRKVMPDLAEAGYHVVAFDQRGYGRTKGWDSADMSQFTWTNAVRDVVVLVNALGHRVVECIVGHDFGAKTSAMCALMRPDLFKSVVMMSHPFSGSPSLPFNTAHGKTREPIQPLDIQQDLARLREPRKHYKWDNATSVAADHWDQPPQGMEAFLRGYLHVKSADWEQNRPLPLREWSADELSKLPYYYVMPLEKSMPETVASMMENEDANKTKRWMTDEDLQVYVQEWTRTGFQGGLNWYRTSTDPLKMADLDLFANKKIECPAIFISGARDWGNHQEPKALEKMPQACEQFKGIKLIDGAGHWPQQERSDEVVEHILGFLKGL